MFKKEYVENLLKPFEGKRMRMRNSVDDTQTVVTETAVSSDFYFRIDGTGISFYVNGYNKSVNDTMRKSLRDGFKSIDVNMVQLENFREVEGDICTFDVMIRAMMESMEVQIGRIYFVGIKSMMVNEKSFYVNGTEFFIS